MTDLNDLIARIEAATEGGRELDKDIAIAVGTYSAPDRGDPFGTWPAYTTLLDAALTLVPGGARIRIEIWPGEVEVDITTCSYNNSIDRAVAPTAALALCAAALRARRAVP